MTSSGPGPLTTFEDLANLGWTKQEIFNKLNDLREGTLDEVHLNDDFCKDQSWYSYNVTQGDLIKESDIPSSVNSSETVWQYDNSHNDQPFKTTWTERWIQSTTASVSVSTAASIALSASFNIPDVGGTSLSVSISSTTTTTQTVTDAHELTNTWDLTIGPHEILKLDRLTTNTTQKVLYKQEYGIGDDTQGLIGTQGQKWKGHYYWAWPINYVLERSGKPPSGTLILTGDGHKQSFDHKITRTPGTHANRPEVTELKSIAHLTNVDKKKLHIAIPGHDDKQ